MGVLFNYYCTLLCNFHFIRFVNHPNFVQGFLCTPYLDWIAHSLLLWLFSRRWWQLKHSYVTFFEVGVWVFLIYYIIGFNPKLGGKKPYVQHVNILVLNFKIQSSHGPFEVRQYCVEVLKTSKTMTKWYSGEWIP